MAQTSAIAVTGQTILAILASSAPASEFGNAQFELYQPANFLQPMDEGVSLFLYRLEINAALRNFPHKPVLNSDNRRPPLPLDLYFVLTAWAKTAVKQQRLLGFAMRALEDYAVLPANFLNSQAPEAAVFQPHETVEIVFQSLNLQDWSNIWGALKIAPPPSVGYIARIVGIESPLVEPETFPLVNTRELAFAKN